MSRFSESVVEDAALAWLEALGYGILHGPEIAAGEPRAERSDPNYRDVLLEKRLRQALMRLNPTLSPEAIEDAYRKLTRVDAPSLLERNRALHRMLVDGVTVEYRRKDGSIAGAQAQVVDFEAPANNDWLAVNQFTVSEGQHTRRPDVVLFLNGLPLAVIELKNPADENATVWAAFQQLQTYQAQIPALFATNAVLLASDGVQARIGSLGAGKEWFKPWRTITGREDAPPQKPELQVVIEGIFAPRRFLDLVRDFIVFEDEGGGRLVKKMAGYHQFHAVRVAVAETLRAAELARAGLVAEETGRYEAGRKPGGKSTCKGILAERKAACDDAWDLPKLLKETLGHLRLVPAGLAVSKEVSDSLRKTAGGLQTVIQGICEIRNSHGFASHGKDPEFQQLDGVQALLVARASDAIVSFLYRMHRDPEDVKPAPVPSFADFAAFNDYVDEANGPVRIFDLEYRASEVLFHVDPRAYQDYLAGFEPEETEADS